MVGEVLGDVAQSVKDFLRGTDVSAETEQSFIDYLEARRAPDALYVVLIRPSDMPLEPERKQLVRVDAGGVRTYEWAVVEGRGLFSERFLPKLKDTELIIERGIDDKHTDRLLEPHELRFEGPATAFGLRGTVRMLGFSEDDKQALVERFSALMA
jgi:hypothetical protein